MAQIVSFQEWFDGILKKKKISKSFYHIPASVTVLPCGCHRQKNNDNQFTIKKSNGIWIHVDRGCTIAV